MPRLRHVLAGLAGIFLVALAIALAFDLLDPEDDAPADADDASQPLFQCGQVSGQNATACTWQVSAAVDFSELVDQVNQGNSGNQVDSSTPVWIQASSGEGGTKQGGRAGYAITVSKVEALQDETLYLYVGQNGTHNNSTGTGGQGGSSSVVSTTQLSGSSDGVLVVAGGSGGGGGGSCDSGKGGDGGVAIATNSAATGAGGDGQGYEDGRGGNANGDGGGGTTNGDGYPGKNGYGGFGGAVGSSLNPVPWSNIDAVDPDAEDWPSQGGDGDGGKTYGKHGGAGGGGYGGGAAGEGCQGGNLDTSGGGGGGGSMAVANAVNDPNAPTQYFDTAETITLSFDLAGG